MKNCAWLVIFFLTAISGLLNAQILNGSFEEDPFDFYWDSTGIRPEVRSIFWAGTNDVNTVTGQKIYVTVEPNDGNNFVALQSFTYHGEPDCTELSQIIDVNAGDCIKGAYFFDANDYIPYDDVATIILYPVPDDPCSGPSQILLAQKSVSDEDIGDFGAMSGWQEFSHIFKQSDAGRYILSFRVENGGDHQLPSYLLIDNIRIVSGQSLPGCQYIIAGDLNDDCRVDFADFALMTSYWAIDCAVTPEEPACISK